MSRCRTRRCRGATVFSIVCGLVLDVSRARAGGAPTGHVTRRATPVCLCPPAQHRVGFTTTAPNGSCGALADEHGTRLVDLGCGTQHEGGGRSAVLPLILPPGAFSLFEVGTCDGTLLQLAGTTAAEVGSDRSCTRAGCFFGPPMPVPSRSQAWLSKCIVNVLAADARGELDCHTGEGMLKLIVRSDVYLQGDVLPDPGVQACPVCMAGACRGGSNDRGSCTPGSDTSAEYPTSVDCPPDAGRLVVTVTRPFALTTASRTRKSRGAGLAGHVFCGYCRDADDSLCFEGDTASGCPPSRGARQPRACASGAGCAQPFEACEQRSPGAFAHPQAAVIALQGKPAGTLADGEAHPLTLVEESCIPPTFNSMVDAAIDLPGPGAWALSGLVQLLRDPTDASARGGER